MDNKPLTLNTKPGVPTLSICAFCTKEIPQVDAAVRSAANQGGIRFSHGSCINHIIQQYRDAKFPEQQIQTIVQKYATSNTSVPPDLREHPELVQLYSQGKFFPQQQATLKERFQKLANIIKDIKNGT